MLASPPPLLWCKGVVSMKRRPRLGGGSRSRCDRVDGYFRVGPRGSDAVRVVPRRGSSLLRAALERSRGSGRGGWSALEESSRSGREDWLRTELARAVIPGRAEGGEVSAVTSAGLD